MTKETKKRQITAKKSTKKTKPAPNEDISQVPESVEHLTELHKLQAALLRKLHRQIENIAKNLKN